MICYRSELLNIFTPNLISLITLTPFAAIDLYSKYMAHEDLFYGLKIIEGSQFFTLEDPIRNLGWALQGGVELNSFANISSNICSVLIIPYCLFHLFFSVSVIARIQWTLLAAGAVGNGIESALFRSATDFIYIHDTGTFLDGKVANLADLYIMLGIFVVLLRNFLQPLFPDTQDTSYSNGTKRKQFIYTNEKMQEVIERYKTGESLEEISLIAKTSVPSVRGKLVHAGVYVSGSSISHPRTG